MNLFDLSGSGIDKEKFDTLLSKDNVTIERIISHAQSTPEGEWYDQTWDEWVIVIEGKAGLLFFGEEDVITLNKGDSIFLPAHQKHRVEWTDLQGPTIWLAVHIRSEVNT